MITDVSKKSKDELLEEFSRHTSHNTLEGEQYTAAIIVKSASGLEESAKDVGERITLLAKIGTEINISFTELKKVIQTSNDNSETLSKKIFWLNCILTFATIVGAIATIKLAIK
jgi:hypothetical protein